MNELKPMIPSRIGSEIVDCELIRDRFERNVPGVMRVERLGLFSLIEEIKNAVTGFGLLVLEKIDANGGAAVRKLLDARFKRSGGWTKKVSGDIDWAKCKQINGTSVCVGVEVQVSARSDLLVVDMIHLTAAFREGRIDVGVLVVPSERAFAVSHRSRPLYF